jgi:hypothetical protein
MHRRRFVELGLGLGLPAVADESERSRSQIDLSGLWRPESYLLSDGSRHAIDGLVFFTDREWSFLVFVTEGGKVRRSEGEGGTYTLKGDELVFTHLYLLLVGEAVGSLPETPLRTEIHDAADAPRTGSRVALQSDRLTITFGPSGNSMTFRRG